MSRNTYFKILLFFFCFVSLLGISKVYAAQKSLLFYCNYNLHTRIDNNGAEVRIPLTVFVYDGGTVRYKNLDQNWYENKGSDNVIYISNGSQFGSVWMNLSEMGSYYNEATKDNKYSCPSLTVVTNTGNSTMYKLLVGSSITTTEIATTEGGTPQTHSRTCKAKYTGKVGNNNIDFELHFKMFKGGKTETCIKDENGFDCSFPSQFTLTYDDIIYNIDSGIYKQTNMAMINNDAFICPETLYFSKISESSNQIFVTLEPPNSTIMPHSSSIAGESILQDNNNDDDKILKVTHQCTKKFIKGDYAALDYNFDLELNLLSNGTKQICIDTEWADKICKDVQYTSDHLASWVVTIQKGYYTYDYFIESKERDKFFVQDDQDRQNQTFKCPENIYIYYSGSDEMGFTTDRNDFDDSIWNDELGDSSDDNDPEYSGGEPVYGCKVIPEEIRIWIRDALNLVKYIALVIVVVLGILDFLKAAGSGEAEAMKKAGNDFLKRIIAVVILFLLPVIVDLILNLIEIAGIDKDNPLCKPTNN